MKLTLPGVLELSVNRVISFICQMSFALRIQGGTVACRMMTTIMFF